MLDSLLDEIGAASGENVKVAIVDSGVDPGHAWVGGRLAASYAVMEAAGGYKLIQSKGGDVVGHGTAVAGQIRRFAPNVDLISLQILGGGLRADSEALLGALRWLISQDVQVINLSLSTMREQLALRIGHVVDELYARDKTVICARGYHRAGRAYPTDFASTIAVSYQKLKTAQLVFRPQDSVEFDASGTQIEVAWKSTESQPDAVRVVEGSSFACPLVTGLAARMVSACPGMTPYELKTLMKAYAVRQQEGWWEPWMDEADKAPD